MRFLSTEQLAGMSARRPWLVIASWVGLLVVAFFLIVTLLGLSQVVLGVYLGFFTSRGTKPVES